MPDTPELRSLRYFVAVAEELHFGKAATRLHISQPSLSVQIRKLEHSLGARLFERTSRHVELTVVGKVLLNEAHRLLTGADRLVATTREAARGVHGTLVVGFQGNAAAELTPKILTAFQTRHPRVQVEMRSHDFADPYVGLVNGSVDVAFVRPPLLVHDWLNIETLFIEPRLLVTSTASELAGRPRVSVEEVASEAFVGRRAPEYWRDSWLATDSRGSHPVKLGADVGSVDECFEAILAGRGVAFTQASTQRFYDRPGLTFIPVDGLPPSTLAIAWRNDMDAPPVNDFIETARMLAALDLVPGALAPPAPGLVSAPALSLVQGDAV
ncbi:LysR family transcriptional regulator [Modestobacter lacusdianchii]